MIKFEVGWIKLLEQRTWVFFSLAIFSGSLRILIGRGELPFLAQFVWLKDGATVATLLFALLTVGSIVHLLLGWLKEQWNIRSYRKAVLARLNSLNDVEHRILSYLVHSNCQSFDYRNDDGDVQQLVGKGLLFTPPGQYNFHMVPFIVPDFVWRELGRRRKDFSSSAPPEDPPWVKNWMAY